MNSYLVDVNVWLALLVRQHPHHAVTREWYRVLAAGAAGMCRITQLGIIRLMGTANVMQGEAIPAAQAWLSVQELLGDERVEFLEESAGINTVLPGLFRYRVPTPALVTDAYLAAFAIASRRRFVTRDRGFQQFRGLEVEILGD